MLYLHELRPREYARLESNQRPLPSHGSALCPLSYGRERSLRQESNLRLGRTKGACWPLTLRRLGRGCRRQRRGLWPGVGAITAGAAGLREWRRRESNPLLLGASEVPIPMSFIPR